jgi:membrane fusion protein (multidrug efflux system)
MNAVLAAALLVAAPADRPVQVHVATASSAARVRHVAATVVPAERATISTRLSARVMRVHVREGDRVRAGAPLVSLAAEELRGQLAAARAALEAARAHERRVRALLGERAATPAELEQAEAQRALSEAAVASAAASLGYAELRAPFAGVVQARRVQDGDFVAPGQPLLELDGARGLELQATLSGDEVRSVRPGARVRFEASGLVGTAEVIALAPGGDPLSHRVSLRARVVEGAADLRSGAFARVELPRDAARATILVPRTAIVERGDLTGVFVVEDGRARLRWLAVGEPAGELLAVRAGLRAGEHVVDRPGGLADGARVEVSDVAR